MNRQKLIMYLLALFTLVVFPLLGLVIFSFFKEKNFVNFLLEGKVWQEQLLWGTGYGTITGFGALWIVQQPFMQEAKQYFSSLLGPMQLNWADVFFISLCAGFGEEILFRGALQPLIGLWPAAILFVLVHGYINSKNKNLSIYGFYLIAVSAGFGYLFRHQGILAPAIAHTIVDVILLQSLRRNTVQT